MWRLLTAVLVCAQLASSAGCSARRDGAVADDLAAQQHDPLFSDEDEPQLGFPDPLEPVNRVVLRANEEIDRWLLDPVTRLYRFMVPDFAKHGLRNAFANINSPVTLANDVFQCEFHDAGVTVWRFIVNTTLGLGGTIDVGYHVGLPGHDSDFEQTLAIYGVPSGPFLILPVFGPTTVRGGAGTVIDLLFRPTAYLLGPADQLTFTIIQGGSSGLATREANYDALKALHETAVDYYAALRNAYYQNRTAEIWRRRPEDRPLP